MKLRHALLIPLLMLAACSTINVSVTGDENRISIEQPKTVSTSAANPTGNTIPVSAVP